MKTPFFSLIFLSFSGIGFSQTINFDDSINLFRIKIDTTIPNNIWQIGQPQKNIFTSARSLPNAMVTDLHLSYPINNNSIFYLGTGGDYWGDIHESNLFFWYKFDSDSLHDYGKIEASSDTGHTWYNIVTDVKGFFLIQDSLGNVIESSGSNDDTLVFTGTTNGWYKCSAGLMLTEGINYDTIIYRFTFHSDNIFDNRDGWIIDDFLFYDWWESVPRHASSYKLYPNPAKNEIHINSKSMINSIELYNEMGILINTINIKGTSMIVNISNLGTGLYFYHINFENGQKDIGKFIKYP